MEKQTQARDLGVRHRGEGEYLRYQSHSCEREECTAILAQQLGLSGKFD